jgi:hypothetical protein
MRSRVSSYRFHHLPVRVILGEDGDERLEILAFNLTESDSAVFRP